MESKQKTAVKMKNFSIRTWGFYLLTITTTGFKDVYLNHLLKDQILRSLFVFLQVFSSPIKFISEQVEHFVKLNQPSLKRR